MKNVTLVTGAGGFIGRHLVRALRARTQKTLHQSPLRLFLWHDEDGTEYEAWSDAGIEIVRGDIRSPEDMFQAMKDVKSVYHLAARTDFAGKSLNDYFDVNVVGTQNILDAGRHHGLEKIIFYSSMAVHGIPAEVGPIEGWTENYAPQRPVFTTPYGHSKWIAEQRIKFAYQEYGVRYAIIRPTSVYGPGENGPTKALISAIDSGYYFQIGSGKNLMDYVYVTDLVEGTLQAADSMQPTGIATFTGPKPVSLREITDAIAEALGKKIPSWYVPGWFMLLLVWPLGLLKMYTSISFPLYPQRVRTLLSTYWFDTTASHSLYGYAPKVSLQDGMRQTVEWYKQCTERKAE